MSSMNVYLTNSAGAAPVSSGDLLNPIQFTINPDVDPDEDKTLYLANERATLNGQINDETDTIVLNESGRFANGDYIIIGDEVLFILSGGGSTTLTVERGRYNTTPAVHATGAVVYSGYRWTDITVEFVDNDGTDETDWTRLAWAGENLNDKEDGNSITASAKDYDEVLEFKMRLTVPTNQAPHIKSDLAIRVTAIQIPAMP